MDGQFVQFRQRLADVPRQRRNEVGAFDDRAQLKEARQFQHHVPQLNVRRSSRYPPVFDTAPDATFAAS